MESLLIMSSFPYILPLLIIVLSPFLFFFVFQNPKANVPPGSSGWPVVGENIKLVLSGPQEFIQERTKKYSQDVFKTSLFGQKMAVFCGPRGNKFVFSNETKSLASWWPLSEKKVLFFPEVVECSTDEIGSLMYSFMHEILKPDALKQYVPVMDSMAREHTLWTVHSTHKNPRYFTDPETFDPSRFQGNGPAPHTFVPFGGGARMCPGKEYARIEVLVFLHNIVTKFKLTKVSPKEKIVLHYLPLPMEGLPVQLIPHKST